MLKLVEQRLQFIWIHPAGRAGLTRQIPKRSVVLLLIDDGLFFVDADFDPLQGQVEIAAEVLEVHGVLQVCHVEEMIGDASVVVHGSEELDMGLLGGPLAEALMLPSHRCLKIPQLSLQGIHFDLDAFLLGHPLFGHSAHGVLSEQSLELLII